MPCPTIVHDLVCVEALVTVTPGVTVGEIETFCVGNPNIGGCGVPTMPTCTFRVSQQICVQIPLTFSATADADPTGIVCNEATLGDCSQIAAECTHTIGFFRNHPTETNALITAAGGAIILGNDSLGLSFTVTTANANAVLDFNTPSPPAPVDPPFANQYQVLYAQLLAANLNIENGAVCPFAENAIIAANNFLAASPAGGMAGAPALQDALELYNSGGAPGCPLHCDEL